LEKNKIENGSGINGIDKVSGIGESKGEGEGEGKGRGRDVLV